MATVQLTDIGEIECVRSPRVRSIRILVRCDGSVRLTYPTTSNLHKAMAFAESRKEWIMRTRNRLLQRKANTTTITRSQVEELRSKARRYIPQTIERLSLQTGLGYSSLRISSAHTRWGSCSGRNGISISLFVMLLPEHLRELIILHELCHTRHHNHSSAFHALLNTLTNGNEQKLNKELRTYHIPQIVE